MALIEIFSEYKNEPIWEFPERNSGHIGFQRKIFKFSKSFLINTSDIQRVIRDTEYWYNDDIKGKDKGLFLVLIVMNKGGEQYSAYFDNEEDRDKWYKSLIDK